MSLGQQVLFVVDRDSRARQRGAAIAVCLGIRCKAYDCAEEFIRDYCSDVSGCLVADSCLNGMDGLELQERLVASGSRLPVILVSAQASVPMAVRAMQNGALTFIEKPYNEVELTDAIRVGLQRDHSLRAVSAQRKETQRRIDKMSSRERQVLDMVIAGTPNKAIARRIGVGHRTVDRLRASVFSMMDVVSAAELAHMVADLRAAVQTSKELGLSPHWR